MSLAELNAEHGPTQLANPEAHEADAVAAVLQRLALLPMHAVAESRNQSLPSLLRDTTGMSKAWISKARFDNLRGSTLQKIEAQQNRLLREAIDDPEVLELARTHLAASPKTRSGLHAPWTGWLHQLEWSAVAQLPQSKAVAQVIDEIVEALGIACRERDLPAFKNLLLRHEQQHGEVIHLAVEPDAARKKQLTRLAALTTWSEAGEFSKALADKVYWDVISTLDAEWSSLYFAGAQTAPLFPLVLPQPQQGLLETRVPRSRKNLFYQPARRLLQFMYAFAYFRRYRKWPARPKAHVLASILYRDKDAVMSDALVSSYFDGTTKLTLEATCAYWDQLMHHFSASGAKTKENDVVAPIPLIVLALQWQSLFMAADGKSAFLPDLDQYKILWSHRRAQWTRDRAKTGGQHWKVGRATTDVIEWPTWSGDQSSPSPA